MKPPNQHFYTILLIILITTLLPSHLAYSSPAPTINTKCEAGACGSTSCDYRFYIDTTTYLAENCTTNQNDYQNTDFITVYNAATTACPITHCNLEFRSGNYTINSALTVNSYYQLIGTGMQTTTIYLNTNANSRMITTPSLSGVAQYILIRDLTLNGNKANNPTGQQAIYLQTWRSRISNVYIYNVKGTGIEISGLGLSNFAIENIMENSVVDTFDGAAGVFINQRAPDNFLHNNIIVQQSKQHTCLLVDSADTNIEHNHIYGCVEGIRIRGVTDVYITGNTLESMNTYAIVLQVTTGGFPVKHVLIENNMFFANGLSPTATNPEILLDGLVGTNVQETLITGNSFRNSQTKWIIQGDGNTNSTLVTNNMFTGGGFTSGSVVNGLNSGTDKVRYNQGWTTEAQGSCNISGSTTCTVTHGLAGTPTAITVTAGTTGTGVYYVTSVGATTFIITVTNSGTYTMYWDAEYWP